MSTRLRWLSAFFGIALLVALARCGSDPAPDAPPPADPTMRLVSLVPAGSVPAGNTLIRLVGELFTFGQTVTVGGDVCTGVTLLSATEMTCLTPPKAYGQYDVQTVDAAGVVSKLTNGIVYEDAPTLTVVTPSSGALSGGLVTTVNGTNFQSGLQVFFDGVEVGVNSISPTAISVTTEPHAAGVVGVRVTNPSGLSATNPAAYMFRAPPMITSINPTVLAENTPGYSLTVVGTGFFGTPTVSVGGTPCTSVNSVTATGFACDAPSKPAGVYTFTVVNPDNQSASLVGAITYAANPSIVSVSPISGSTAGGTSVVITGTGFANGATVAFGGTPATGITVDSATQITCTTPAHGAGAVNVLVINPSAQSATLTNGFTFF